jgi:DNA integrity scanning protein DisA with diadenylate cyclase activity
MGNNTIAFFINDFAHEVERDSEKVIQTISHALSSGQGGEHHQIVRVLPSVHADYDQVILAGGNRITALTSLRRCPHTEEGLLHALAGRLGYALVPIEKAQK